MSDTIEMTRAERMAGSLRALAAWLDEHPKAHTYISGNQGDLTIYHHVYGSDEADTVKQLADAATSLGGKWDKVVTDYYFELHQKIAPGVEYHLYASREQVCKRVVVETITKTVDEPDPEAMAQLPTVQREVTEEVVEWQCPPSLYAMTREAQMAEAAQQGEAA